MESMVWLKRSEELRVAGKAFSGLKEAKMRQKSLKTKTSESERLQLLATKGRKAREQQTNASNEKLLPMPNLIRIRRLFLIGNDGVTYEANQSFPRENLWTLAEIINDGDAYVILNEIWEYSLGKRISRQESTLFGLALCARYRVCAVNEKKENERPITAAYRAYLNAMHLTALSLVNHICPGSVDLFQFIDFCNQITDKTNNGNTAVIWEPAMKEAIFQWYSSKSPEELAFEVTKCSKFGRWSHQLLFKLCDAKVTLLQFDPQQLVIEQIYRYISHGALSTRKLRVSDTEIEKWYYTWEQLNSENDSKALDLIEAFKWMNKDTVVDAIRSHRLSYEHIPAEYLELSAVWEALIDGMPYAFLLDCLEKIAIVSNIRHKRNPLIAKLCQKLSDKDTIKESKVNPVQVLMAIEDLQDSRLAPQLQSKNQIVEALELAFTRSFDTEALTGKSICFGVDFSVAMTNANDEPSTITRSKAAVMMMIGLRSGAKVEVMNFDRRQHNEFQHCHFDRRTPIQQICQNFDQVEGCGRLTCDMCHHYPDIDCNELIMWATRNSKKFDCFCVITARYLDHGADEYNALNEYRKNYVHEARLMVIAMRSYEDDLWLEDPSDMGVLHVNGFNSDLPEIMMSFIKGDI
ncbi:unnamed protein product, partial [Mesorhabditis belari]|uniref:TROVE domain-containing protein n=1 Tax=Mesorhabditis belari TaxID=2138241 RepID=A0AAF3J230_9BILA